MQNPLGIEIPSLLNKGVSKPSSKDSFLSKKTKEAKATRDFFLISEIGTSHLGDLDLACEMIDVCVKSGVGAVKFQYVIAEEILHPDCGSINLTSGDIDLFDYFKKIEEKSNFQYWEKIAQYCQQKKILFLCSFFGAESFKQLLKLRLPAYKIASPEMNYYALWNLLKPLELPVIFSSGMSKPEDLKHLMSFLNLKNFRLDNLIHLLCVTQYPALEEAYNLLFAYVFQKEYRVLAGVSDHTGDPDFLPKVFTVLQSILDLPVVIEKHFNLSSQSGIDDPVSLDENSLPRLIKECQNLYSTISKHPDRPAPIVLENYLKDGQDPQMIDFIKEQTGFSSQRIKGVIGDGIKKLSPQEMLDYPTTKRSLLAIKDIAQGEDLNYQNMAYLRAEKNHLPGLDYHWGEKILGYRAKEKIANGLPITENNIEKKG